MLKTNHRSKFNEQCPVCGSEAKIDPKFINNISYNDVNCTRCGFFIINEGLVGLLYKYFKKIIDGSENNRKKLSLSHFIAKMINKSKSKNFEFTKEMFDNIKDNLSLPNPAEQADNLILYLGDNSEAASQEHKLIKHDILRISAIVGSYDEDAFIFVLEHLKDSKIITQKKTNSITSGNVTVPTNFYIKFTFTGWQKYEELKKDNSDNNQVFMAMKFFEDKNEPTEVLYDKFLKKAIKQLGLNLRRIDEIAKAGIIDNNLRIEIRKSCLLFSELTHDNNGAYFEAGFADSLNIPVIYLCEKKKFDAKKTHFDTNHCTTIIWEKGKEAKAMEKLKATIKLSVPDKVKMEDGKTR